MKRILLIIEISFLTSGGCLFGQVNFNIAINQVLAAGAAGIKLPDGTIVTADSIKRAGQFMGQFSGSSGPNLGGFFDNATADETIFSGSLTGNTMPLYHGSSVSTNFTRIHDPAPNPDGGNSNNCANFVGFWLHFDRPVTDTSGFLFVDIDNVVMANNNGSGEWCALVGFNGSSYQAYDPFFDTGTFLVSQNITVPSSWDSVVTDKIGVAAGNNMPVTLNGARVGTANGSASLDPDFTTTQVLFKSPSPTNVVTDIFIFWGVWANGTPFVQNSGFSPFVATLEPDFGDAPDTYLTTLASGGPSHGRTDSLTLGTIEDASAPDGTPSTLANAEIDDDGVVVTPIVNNGATTQILTYSLTTSFTNTTTRQANFVAWIDWNNNGVFDVSEAQTASSTATSGSITFTWTNVTLTGAAGIGNTYARIRNTTERVLSGADVGGAFKDGEVEDYFIPFAITLPLKLTSFTGKIENDHAVLKWKTNNEVNTRLFQVQSSGNGRDFSTMAEVNAFGNGDNAYSFHDNNIIQTLTYYRLRILDYDGKETFSNILHLRPSVTEMLIISPNPVTNILTVNVSGDFIEQLSVYTAGGQLVTRQRAANLNSITLDCSRITKGMYYLEVITKKGKKMVREFTKQ